MSKSNKNMPSKADVQTTKLNRVVDVDTESEFAAEDTESEFASEYGAGLYGNQAREAYEQENVVDENSMFKP